MANFIEIPTAGNVIQMVNLDLITAFDKNFTKSTIAGAPDKEDGSRIAFINGAYVTTAIAYDDLKKKLIPH